MKRTLLITLVSLSTLAVDDLNFIRIKADIVDQQVKLSTEAVPFFSYDRLNSKDFTFERSMMEAIFDAPYRQTVFMLRTVDRNRGLFEGKISLPLEILSFKMAMNTRTKRGTPINEHEYEVKFGLDEEPNTCFVACNGLRKTFDLNKLTRGEYFREFLNYAVFPFGSKQFELPQEGQGAFLVDLYYTWPKVTLKQDDLNLFDLFPSLLLWNKGIVTKVEINLGGTYCYRTESGWKKEESSYINTWRENLNLYSEILDSDGDTDRDPEAYLDRLRQYVARVPNDKRGLERLMNALLEEEYFGEAVDLLERNEPFFATIRDGLPNLEALKRKHIRRRDYLYANRDDFQENKKVKLAITSPENDDLIATGKSTLLFEMSGNESPILAIDCFIDNQLITRIDKPPFRIPFTVYGERENISLRVIAYFEDETFQSDKIRVTTMKVDEAQQVNLVAMRAVVAKGRGEFLTDLALEDFAIEENEKAVKIKSVQLEEAPLRVAMVVDNSISMFGPKLYKALYGIDRFINNMEQDDRVAVYSFNHKVMMLADFTNAFAAITPQFFTLSPQLSTALYDAVFVAADALRNQNGAKVVVILSDGADSNSNLTDLHIINALAQSDIMVYSVMLPGGVLSQDDFEGYHFLKQLAEFTGSVSTKIHNVNDVETEFQEIYKELKSYYYIEYYSELPLNADRKIKVKVDKARTRVRWRLLQ